MSGPLQNPMRCPEFEGIMAEALDGLLPEYEHQRFQQHRDTCPHCGPMLAEAETGRLMLRSLNEVIPPPDMVARILSATSGPVDTQRLMQTPATTWDRVRAWGREYGLPKGWNSLAPLFQPRFAMSFAMAFFSITMLMNLFGVRVSDFQLADLRPANFVRAYEQTTGSLVRYYENLRIVYEIQSRVDELRQSTQDTQTSSPDDQPKPAPPTGGLQPGAPGNSQRAWVEDTTGKADLMTLLNREMRRSQVGPGIQAVRSHDQSTFSARSEL